MFKLRVLQSHEIEEDESTRYLLAGNNSLTVVISDLTIDNSHARLDNDLQTFQYYMSSIGRDMLSKLDAEFYDAVESLDIASDIPDYSNPCDDVQCPINKRCRVDYPSTECVCRDEYETMSDGSCRLKSHFIENLAVTIGTVK